MKRYLLRALLGVSAFMIFGGPATVDFVPPTKNSKPTPKPTASVLYKETSLGVQKIKLTKTPLKVGQRCAYMTNGQVITEETDKSLMGSRCKVVNQLGQPVCFCPR